MLLPQDLYVLLKLCCLNSNWTFAELSKQLFLSTSQIHLALKRAELAGLYSSRQKKIIRQPLQEFIISGARYAYPAERGGLVHGLPTGFAGPPLNKSIVQTEAPPPVWPYANGKQLGYSVEPLHPSAPKAALADPAFYELLCLFDCLREGRARERKLASEALHERIGIAGWNDSSKTSA
jgi:hypothetical protein